MKSTLKIDYERGHESFPVIKIITPLQPQPLVDPTPGYSTDTEEDVRDKLTLDFLHSPYKVDRNYFFELKSYFPIANGNLTTIGAIDEKDLLHRFKHAILYRFVPYLDLVKINRGEISNKAPSEVQSTVEENFRKSHDKYIQINAFFNYLDKVGYCTWEEQQSDLEQADKNSTNWDNVKHRV